MFYDAVICVFYICQKFSMKLLYSAPVYRILLYSTTYINRHSPRLHTFMFPFKNRATGENSPV